MIDEEKRPTTKEDRIPISRLMRARDVAEILGISTKTVNKLAREGKLGCVRVTAKDRRFSEEQIQEYIESRTSKVQIDAKAPVRVKSSAPKGGEKSSRVFNRADLLKEIRSWQ